MSYYLKYPQQSVEEATEMMADLRSMAREVKAVCLTDGVAVPFCFAPARIITRALREGIYLTKCKKQWAARALLAKTFKSSDDNKKRKEKASQAINQLSTSGVKRFFPKDIDTPSPLRYML
ncbi:hypothetical protein BDB01DRAFT_856807 [Pilobolus umbonatus]|nr:hypothetical protein BDB01DRAFT_856807 [Pilobolus umbonatus]